MISTVSILLVEDEPLIALSLQESLEAGGYSVTLAHDGTQALEVIEGQGNQVSGVVTDVRLGCGPTGWDVARRARELNSDVPIVYTSGDSAHEWTVQGVPNSVMVQKPFAPAQVLTAISTLLTQSDANAAR